MEQAIPAVDPGHDLRREINALQGLLYFSMERHYPEGIVVGLKEMLNRRELVYARLADHDATQNCRQPLDAA